MASVRICPKSPYYIADLRLWVVSSDHPGGGYFKKTRRSTPILTTQPKAVALTYAREEERMSREARDTKLPSKRFFETRVAALMRAAGLEETHNFSTWREYSQRWLAASTAGEKSLIKYRGEIEQFSKYLGVRAGHDLRTIKSDDFDGFHKQLTGEGRSANTARNTCKTVRSVFTRAVKEHYADDNPGGLTVLKGDLTGSRLPYTREDMAAIFATVARHEKEALRIEWRRACLFGLFYGMRISDAVNRSGKEIHLENGVWVIRFIPEKKRAKGQEIALPLVGELSSLAELKGTGLITPHLANYAQPTKPYTLILRDSGILIRRKNATGPKGRKTGDKSFHSWRHTANTLLNDAGVDSKVRQLICDHDDSEMNARYTHASVQTMSEAISKAMNGLPLGH